MNLQYEDQDQNKPPYESIGFVHSYTIGGKHNKKAAQTYNWQYTDILIPKNTLQQPILYYFFHIPGIYNWIRNIDIDIDSQQKIDLNQYIKNQKNQKKTQKPSSALKINFDNLLNFSFTHLLTDYIKKWEIVKISACCKVYIKNILSQHFECTHLPKKVQWVKVYNYNQNDRKFQVKQVFCNQCKKDFKVTTTIESIPFAPIFGQFYGNKIQIEKNKYNLVMAFTLKGINLAIYIKSSNNVWYQVQQSHKQDQSFVKTVGVDKISFKKGNYFVYLKQEQKQIKGQQVLRASQPLNLKRQANNQGNSIKLTFQQIFQQKKRPQQIKKTSQDKKKSISREKYTEQNNQQLQSLQKNVNQIIIPQQKQEKLKQYSKLVSKLYNKPQQKDDYDKQYDKGKTKKIKKKKQYIKPDFNEIYKRIKQQEINKQKDQFYQQYQKVQYDKNYPTQKQDKQGQVAKVSQYKRQFNQENAIRKKRKQFSRKNERK